MLHARSSVLACGVPLLALVVAGCQPERIHPVAVAICLVGELACVIWFNPWGCLNRCLPPLSRSMMILSILLVAMAAAMAVMEAPIVAVLLILLAAGCVAVALWRRKAWLLAWEVQQSPEVDTVLAHLTHGGEWEPGTAWEQDGCRQTRALLHQALGMECNEDELTRAYKAVYLLAYLSGMEGRQAETDRLKKKLSEAEIAANGWKDKAILREDTAAELDYTKRRLQETQEALSAAQAEAQQYRQELEDWKPANEPENRDESIRAYVQAGNSYQKAADKFGLSKAQVGRIVKAETVS
ncbi:MAG: hypothetical protein LUD84_09630 [Clostridiales bacterium]|nr:hypothetical protein [Clostridiales bacterium]